MFRKQTAFRHQVAGLTLVEILVAMAILGIATAALIMGLLGNARSNTVVQQRAEAARIIESEFERYRQTNDYATLQSGTSASRTVDSTVTRNGLDYTVTATFCPTDIPDATKAAMPCSATAVYIRLEVKNGTQTLQKAETYYTKFGRAD